MFAAILAVALSQWGPEPSPGMQQYDPGSVCGRAGGRCFLNRSSNRPRENYAFFEFAPTSGAGMGTACAGTAVTAVNGLAASWSRAGSATCAKQGPATTGVANGDLVTISSNLPRVESFSGTLAVLSEPAATNLLPRFIEYNDAAWANVGAPTQTTGQTSPWTGTYATSAVQYNDTSAAAFEGRTQTISVSAATQYTMCCYVKANSLNNATVSLDGTTNSITGLSSTTWSLVSVTDVSSSGVAIAAQILNGSTTAATGTVIWGGCQVEAGSYCMSMIPTVAASASRAVDQGLTATLPSSVGPSMCLAATYAARNSAVGAVNIAFLGAAGTTEFGVYRTNDTAGGFDIASVVTAPAVASQGTTAHRLFLSDASGTRSARFDNGAVAAPAATITAAGTQVRVGVGPSAAAPTNGWVWNVQIDPSPTRCTP